MASNFAVFAFASTNRLVFNQWLFSSRYNYISAQLKEGLTKTSNFWNIVTAGPSLFRSEFSTVRSRGHLLSKFQDLLLFLRSFQLLTYSSSSSCPFQLFFSLSTVPLHDVTNWTLPTVIGWYFFYIRFLLDSTKHTETIHWRNL